MLPYPSKKKKKPLAERLEVTVLSSVISVWELDLGYKIKRAQKYINCTPIWIYRLTLLNELRM